MPCAWRSSALHRRPCLQPFTDPQITEADFYSASLIRPSLCQNYGVLLSNPACVSSTPILQPLPQARSVCNLVLGWHSLALKFLVLSPKHLSVGYFPNAFVMLIYCIKGAPHWC